MAGRRLRFPVKTVRLVSLEAAGCEKASGRLVSLRVWKTRRVPSVESAAPRRRLPTPTSRPENRIRKPHERTINGSVAGQSSSSEARRRGRQRCGDDPREPGGAAAFLSR